jgi:hypothetical protein
MKPDLSLPLLQKPATFNCAIERCVTAAKNRKILGFHDCEDKTSYCQSWYGITWATNISENRAVAMYSETEVQVF